MAKDSQCSCPKPDLATRRQEKQLSSKAQWWLKGGGHKKIVHTYYCKICGLTHNDPDMRVRLAMNFFAPPKTTDKETQDAQD